MSSGNVKVVCRFRPLSKAEQQSGTGTLSVLTDETMLRLETRELNGSFVFDRVFNESSRQLDVFEYSIRSTVDDILNGYNGTILAYGHTGSGKTYTMMGPDIEDEELKGVIPRIATQIFKSIMESLNNVEYTVKVSYMEIYMERIKDLLCPQNDHLPIHEEKSRGVYVKGLREVYVSSLAEIYQIIKKGNQVRVAAATNVNAESSRSHSIFCIIVTQKNLETGNIKSGQLFLVDLAGSEKVAKTGASGQTLEEAKKINKSLSTLGLVINSLTDGKSTHIPYRDSKLTRILQESLGGNSRTTLIINCSLSLNDESETISSIRFGMRAKKIKNKARINQELSSNELKHLLKKAKARIVAYSEYIVALENELDLWRNGEKVFQEKWTPRMVIDVKESKVVVNNQKNDVVKTTILEKMSVPFIQNIAVEKDERDDFLKRENELQDSITEKEILLKDQENVLKDAKEEILYLKEHNDEIVKINEKLTSELNDLRLQLEKVTYENKEAYITLDSLKYTNSNLMSELDSLKQNLREAKMSMESVANEQPLKKKKIDQKIEEDNLSNTKIVSPKQFLDNIDSLNEISSSNTRVLKDKLTEMQSVISSLESVLNDRMNQADDLKKNNIVLERRLKYAEEEYQFLIDKMLLKENDQHIRTQETLFSQSCNMQIYDNLLQDSKMSPKIKKDVYLEVSNENEPVVQKSDVSDKDIINNTILKNEDFNMMSKSLMKEFRNRRDRVVELEISLNEIREQYSNILRNNNIKIQRKKISSLEKNLEQLTVIQKQLVEQNISLKRGISVAERKLVVRNERILSLEALLHDAQEKLINQNRAFEKQLQILKGRLERARVIKEYSSPSELNFGKIAKPLRGGID
ncbi:hypothetical protein PORY_002362 [Pneumocystis oryctolagi]|uniref:Uncharacterized protein n=1 Tax=Pneumocystis oryctolagi TaxID=42067 RepID=A0ACB7C9I7_9ASCO|nr:hypothetical protein PORY_002362 [Pneumocystis oryctolagi]